MESEPEGPTLASKQGLVSLTYDLAVPNDAKGILQKLDEFELSGTFYVAPPVLLEAPQLWRMAVENGHEIGNGSLHGVHDGAGNLSNWTLQMVEDDLRETQKLLRNLFPGQLENSFGYPGPESLCLDNETDRTVVSYRPVVDQLFGVSRTCANGANHLPLRGSSGLSSLPLRDADEVLEICAGLILEPVWIIFRLEHYEGASRLAHDRLCSWLHQNRGQAVVRTVTSAAKALWQGQPPQTVG